MNIGWLSSNLPEIYYIKNIILCQGIVLQTPVITLLIELSAGFEINGELYEQHEEIR